MEFVVKCMSQSEFFFFLLRFFIYAKAVLQVQCVLLLQLLKSVSKSGMLACIRCSMYKRSKHHVLCCQ